MRPDQAHAARVDHIANDPHHIERRVRFFPAFMVRRRRPAVHITQLSREQIADLVVASAWELTPAQWERLTDHERRECRRTVTVAPRFKVSA